jgi:hypothetical protein
LRKAGKKRFQVSLVEHEDGAPVALISPKKTHELLGKRSFA